MRYTRPNTEVSVTLRLNRDTRNALIAVRDHRPGVPEEALRPIFEPFYRVRDRSELESRGTGLGLAITSRAAVAHRGTVVAANAFGGGFRGQDRVAGSGPRAATSGRRIRKVEPRANSLSTTISPPWRETIHWAIDSPSPAPPVYRDRSFATR